MNSKSGAIELRRTKSATLRTALQKGTYDDIHKQTLFNLVNIYDTYLDTLDGDLGKLYGIIDKVSQENPNDLVEKRVKRFNRFFAAALGTIGFTLFGGLLGSYMGGPSMQSWSNFAFILGAIGGTTMGTATGIASYGLSSKNTKKGQKGFVIKRIERRVNKMMQNRALVFASILSDRENILSINGASQQNALLAGLSLGEKRKVHVLLKNIMRTKNDIADTEIFLNEQLKSIAKSAKSASQKVVTKNIDVVPTPLQTDLGDIPSQTVNPRAQTNEQSSQKKPSFPKKNNTNSTSLTKSGKK